VGHIWLWILAGILGLFVWLLCVKIKIFAAYDSEKKSAVELRWLFFKFQLVPFIKKEKKKKNEKTDKTKEKTDKTKEKRPNPFVLFYKNQGAEGFAQLLENLGMALSGFFRGLLRCFIIEELFIYFTVAKGDAADTAIAYGQTCARVYPAMGAAVTYMKVRAYDFDVRADYLAGRSAASGEGILSVRPLRLLGAALVLAFRLLFGVLLKFFLGTREKKKIKETA
jgi:hypothetical protein